MTSVEFIQRFNDYGNHAKELLVKHDGFLITRGMAHSISGFAEDLFAVFIAQKLNRKDIQYLVDKVMSVRLGGNHKAKSFKPDLAIIDHNVLTHYFDLKTNLGWNRDFTGYLHEKNEFMRQLKESRPWINFPGIPDQHISVSPSCIYQMVVVYGANINQHFLKSNLELSSHLEHVKVHILCPWNEAVSNFVTDEEAFKNIEKTLSL